MKKEMVKPQQNSFPAALPAGNHEEKVNFPSLGKQAEEPIHPGKVPLLPDLRVMGRPDLAQLKEQLLGHGGTGFQADGVLVEDLNPDLIAKLLKQGRVFAGNEAKMHMMVPSECHSNALLLAARGGAQWWTGLALSHDGIWRIHSWAIRNNRLFETTALREKYYGVRVPVSYYTKTVIERQARTIQYGNEMGRVMAGLTESQSEQVIDMVRSWAEAEKREATSYDFLVACKAIQN
jgi:hypothetical protein